MHSDSFKAAVLDEKTDELKTIQVSLAPEMLGRFLGRLTKEDYVAVEASTNTFWFLDQLEGKVRVAVMICITMWTSAIT